jgi:hypothetical protein
VGQGSKFHLELHKRIVLTLDPREGQISLRFRHPPLGAQCTGKRARAGWTDANASANLYSLLQTCAVNGVDGYQYLRALLVQLPKAQSADDYETLLPWRITLKVD